MRLVTVAEMRAIEKEGDARGVSYSEMMERAGTGVARIIHAEFNRGNHATVTALVGPGNNGGDALVALEVLAGMGWRVRAILVRPRPDGDAYVARVKNANGEVLTLEGEAAWGRVETWMCTSDVLVDGVLGTGFQLPLKPELEDIFSRLTSLLLPHHIVAVDCPSGVDCDSGEAADCVIPAELTVCMEAVKGGLLRFPAFNYVGRLEVVDLGLPDDLNAFKAIRNFVVSASDVEKDLPPRPKDAHKGTFGTALVVAGSVNYTGAAALAGEAAYRIGTGLVRMAVPGPLHGVLSGLLPEITWLLLPHEMGVIAEEAADILFANLERVSAILIGPGLNLEPTTTRFIQRVLAGARGEPKREGLGFLGGERSKAHEPMGLPPCVVDADGLKHMAHILEWHKKLPVESILTPHPGEMSVLTGLEVSEIQADRIEISRKYAVEWGHVVVLKGAMTVIAAPDGNAYIVPVATAALARAGTGDVLAGLIVGLRAQGVTPVAAARAGAWIHAQAGLAAIDLVGHPASVLAGDVLAAVPEILRQFDHSAE